MIELTLYIYWIHKYKYLVVILLMDNIYYIYKLYIHNQYIFLINEFIYLLIYMFKIISLANLEHISEIVVNLIIN